MAGVWRRLKLWLRRQALRTVWRIASNRLYRKLRSIVTRCLAPLAAITSGVLVGIGIAAASGLAVGYGVLIGAASAVVGFVVYKVGHEIWRKIQMVNNTRRRIMAWRNDARANVARSSRSQRS